MAPDPAALTDRQLEVLGTIYRLTASGNPPTYRELIRELGVTWPDSIEACLNTLEHKGWLTYSGDGTGYQRSRGIRLKGLVMRPTFTEDAAGERLREAIQTAMLTDSLMEVRP